MPALAPIVLNDGQATPVAHTFNPAGPDNNGVSWLYDRSGGIAMGFVALSLDLRQPQTARNGQASVSSRVYKATVKIIRPTLEVSSPSTGTGIQPAPTKAYETVAKIEFLLPERSTLADRKDILAYAKNALSSAGIITLIQDLESFY